MSVVPLLAREESVGLRLEREDDEGLKEYLI
jgi:hypothetical protein